MTSNPKDLLVIEIAAALTADVQAAPAHLPAPHTPAQMPEAVRNSAATISPDFHIAVISDPDRPAGWKISVAMPSE